MFFKVFLDFNHQFRIAQNINSSHGHSFACNQGFLMSNLCYCCCCECMRMVHSFAIDCIHNVSWRNYVRDITHICRAQCFFIFQWTECYSQGFHISLVKLRKCGISYQVGISNLPLQRHCASFKEWKSKYWSTSINPLHEGQVKAK